MSYVIIIKSKKVSYIFGKDIVPNAVSNPWKNNHIMVMFSKE